MALGGVNKLEQGVNKPSWESVVAWGEALGVRCLAYLAEPTGTPVPKRGLPPKATVERPSGKEPKRPRGRPREEE
jgi:hypothetical protein